MTTLLLADVHANLPALEAVLAAEPDRDRVLFLGDAVDAGPHPDAVLSTLSGLSGTFVEGNHDRAVLAVDPDAPAASHGERWREWTREQLSAPNAAFLAAFGDSCRVASSAGPLRLHHGDFDVAAEAWDGRPWPDTDRAVYAALADRYEASIVCIGHSHVQFELTVDGTRFVNPGSVGQHRLGEVAACYAVIEDGTIRLDAVEYDAERTVADLATLPLDEEYLAARERVYTEGVLPGNMRDFTPLRAAGYR